MVTRAWAVARWRESLRTFFTWSPRVGERTRVQKRWEKHLQHFFSEHVPKYSPQIFFVWFVFNFLTANSQMAEALMLEMDGDSDGSITEEELVSVIFLQKIKKWLKAKMQLVIVFFKLLFQGRGFSPTGSFHNPSCEQGLDFCSHHL